MAKLPFRPVVGTDAQIQQSQPAEGYVWFATDTKKIYLDNAATTVIIPEVKKAMMPFFCDIFANESSSHSMGRDANKYVENAN